MYIFKCPDCGIEYERQRATSCKDGVFRCTTCRNRVRKKRFILSGKHNAYQRWYNKTEKGRDLKRIKNRKRRANNLEWYRMKNRAWQHGLKAIDLIKFFDKHPVCQLCGTTKKLSLDHMHPQSYGGKSNKENFQALCRSCNSWKSNNIFLADNSGYLVGESYAWA